MISLMEISFCIRFFNVSPNRIRGGTESDRAEFNLQELPCYLTNTYKLLPVLLKFIREYDSEKKLVKVIS